MLAKRIIPCLDVMAGRVVKGVQFQELKDQGDPRDLADFYAQEGADELVFLDITAGIEGRDTLLDVVGDVARQVFIPFTVGGGIRKVEDASALLQAGCDKVSINSAAVRRPELISELAERFGRQCVVLAVDVRACPGGHRVMVDAGRTPTDWMLDAWIEEAQARGAGEILLTSMDQDGEQKGYDLDALKTASKIKIPLIASGGLGEVRHALEAFKVGADAVLLASVLHSGKIRIQNLKTELAQNGIEVRPC